MAGAQLAIREERQWRLITSLPSGPAHFLVVPRSVKHQGRDKRNPRDWWLLDRGAPRTRFPIKHTRESFPRVTRNCVSMATWLSTKKKVFTYKKIIIKENLCMSGSLVVLIHIEVYRSSATELRPKAMNMMGFCGTTLIGSLCWEGSTPPD